MFPEQSRTNLPKPSGVPGAPRLACVGSAAVCWCTASGMVLGLEDRLSRVREIKLDELRLAPAADCLSDRLPLRLHLAERAIKAERRRTVVLCVPKSVVATALLR